MPRESGVRGSIYEQYEGSDLEREEERKID